MPGGQEAFQLTDAAEIERWDKIISHQSEKFTTSDFGRHLGEEFTYTIRGAEMFVSSRTKFSVGLTTNGGTTLVETWNTPLQAFMPASIVDNE